MVNKKVTKIEPIIKSTPVRMAAYARVSSSSEEQLKSLESQKEYYQWYIGNQVNTIFVGIYYDEGITGTSIHKRADFQRMILDCELGKVDRIITKSITRFARNFMETLKIVRKLKNLGVSIFFEEEKIDTASITSEIELTAFAQAAEIESKNISTFQQWGFRNRAKEGIYNQSKMPYGYYKKNGIIMVNEKEANHITLLFDLHAIKEWSVYKIKKHLNENRIGGRTWSYSGLIGMLGNERYCGDMLLQKRYTTDEFPYHLVANKGELPQYYVYDVFPSIISKEIFNKSQKRLIKIREKLTSKQVEANQLYTFTSKITCGCCKSIFKRRVLRREVYWSCQKHIESIQNCKVKQVSQLEIEEAFMKVFYKIKDNLYILQRFVSDSSKVNIDKNFLMQLNEIEQDIQQLVYEKKRLLEERFSSVISIKDYQEKLNILNCSKEEMEIEKRELFNRLSDNLVIRNTYELIEYIRNTKGMSEFDTNIFNAIVNKIVIDAENIIFYLNNDFIMPIERKLYYGNYS